MSPLGKRYTVPRELMDCLVYSWNDFECLLSLSSQKKRWRGTRQIYGPLGVAIQQNVFFNVQNTHQKKKTLFVLIPHLTDSAKIFSNSSSSHFLLQFPLPLPTLVSVFDRTIVFLSSLKRSRTSWGKKSIYTRAAALLAT